MTNFYLNTINPNTIPPLRVYISRRVVKQQVQDRSLMNEYDVEEVFKRRGFFILSPEMCDSEYEKQWYLSNASVIAGCVGSGLLNTVFAPNCALIIGLSSLKTLKINPAAHHQYHISQAKDCYFELIVQQSEGETGNRWSINITMLEEILDNLSYPD